MTLQLPPIPSLDLDGDPKLCCATLYDSEAVRWLLGEELHPGGAALTRRLADMAALRAGERVVDVAGGPGHTARLLARELGARVVAVDLGAESVARGRAETERAGLAGAVEVMQGDAEALPLADGAFDVAWSECSLCTFPDKGRAVAEMVRVVRPGGRLAIADVTADVTALPAALQTAAATVACVADARPAHEYVALLEGAGCRLLQREDRSAALLAMIDRVEARLRVARMLAPPGEQRDRVREAVGLTRLARAEAEAGRLGYVLVVAQAPG